MRILPKRSLVATSLAAVLLGGGLAACGDDDDEVTNDAGAPGAPAEPGASTAALAPVSFADPFVGAREAADHMPTTAAALAGGISEATKMKGTVDSPAADLRAQLTFLLTEHVYLAGMAVATAYATSPTSPEFELAANAVDANSVEVAKAIGSVSAEAEEGFLKSWRAHVTDFVNYAVGAKTEGADGKKMQDTAVENLTAYAKSQGAFFDELSGGALPARDIEAAFNEHIGLLAKAVDGFAAGDTKAYNMLKTAAGHMPMMASALATGVDEALELEGDPNDDASGLRSTLTDYLVTHVYLAGVGVFTAYTAEGGAESDQFTAAAGAIDKNSRDLSKAIEGLTDKKTGDAFYDSWSAHVTDFVDYAVGAATNDQAKKDAALNNLDAYRTSAGMLFEEITGGVIPVAAVESEFKTHIESTAGVIDSLKAALVK